MGRSLGMHPRVKSLRSSHTGLYPHPVILHRVVSPEGEGVGGSLARTRGAGNAIEIQSPAYPGTCPTALPEHASEQEAARAGASLPA